MSKTSFSGESRAFNENLIDIILDESTEKMDFEKVIGTIIDGRQQIKDRLLEGKMGSGSPLKYRGPLHYDLPYSYHGNIGGMIWNHLFGNLYGKLVDGERCEKYNFIVPKVGTKDDPMDYVNFVKEKVPDYIFEKLEEVLEKDEDFKEWFFKGGLKYINVPIILEKIPEEILPLIDIEQTVEDNTTSRAARLYELLGIEFVNTSAKTAASNIIEF